VPARVPENHTVAVPAARNTLCLPASCARHV
jgi:hypothetical protein